MQTGLDGHASSIFGIAAVIDQLLRTSHNGVNRGDVEPYHRKATLSHLHESDLLSNGIRLRYYRTCSAAEALEKRGSVVLCHGFSDDGPAGLPWPASSRPTMMW